MADAIVEHVTVTLTASAAALPARGRVRWVSIQPGTANANPAFVGGAGVTTSDFGTYLPASSGSVPSAPMVLGEFYDGAIKLEDIYVIGTASEKVHVQYIRFV